MAVGWNDGDGMEDTSMISNDAKTCVLFSFVNVPILISAMCFCVAL